MIIAGVEEAGRGPVIGPLVMSICACDEKKISNLDNLGVKDSKLLSPSKREQLFESIKEICEHRIIIIKPKEIDEAVLSKPMNLNKLEAKFTAELISLIDADKYIIDCPSNNIIAYEKYLHSLLTKKANIVAEHKADVNHTIVGAASILAKVTRDREIQILKDKIGIDFGSGYPSDPKTVDFLKKYWDKHDFFRKSWATYRKIAEGRKQKSVSDY